MVSSPRACQRFVKASPLAFWAAPFLAWMQIRGPHAACAYVSGKRRTAKAEHVAARVLSHTEFFVMAIRTALRPSRMLK